MNNVYLLTNFPEQLLKIFLPSISFSEFGQNFATQADALIVRLAGCGLT